MYRSSRLLAKSALQQSQLMLGKSRWINQQLMQTPIIKSINKALCNPASASATDTGVPRLFHNSAITRAVDPNRTSTATGTGTGSAGGVPYTSTGTGTEASTAAGSTTGTAGANTTGSTGTGSFAGQTSETTPSPGTINITGTGTGTGSGTSTGGGLSRRGGRGALRSRGPDANLTSADALTFPDRILHSIFDNLPLMAAPAMLSSVFDTLDPLHNRDIINFDKELMNPISIQLSENEQDYLMKVSVPNNLPKEELHIKVQGEVLHIWGRAEKSGRRQQQYLSFSRAMVLPDDVDKNRITAKLENGQLIITLPKTLQAIEEQKKGEIPIQ